MKNIITFAGSNSRNSINKKLAVLASSQLQNSKITILDLNDFPLPLYGIDTEVEVGFPENLMKFNELIASTDGVILSLAEHNGAYTVAFKNLFDWLSRLDKNVWKNKPMLLMSTSPGGRGGASVFNAAATTFPFLGANIVASFSLSFFAQNFSEEKLLDEQLDQNFIKEIRKFEQAL